VKLRRLSPEAIGLVTKELANGELPHYERAAYDRFLDDAEIAVELDDLDAIIDQVIEGTPRHDSVIDRTSAARIHRALPLTRREAANPGVWRYLAVVYRPDFVRHRWEMKSWATARTRFWSLGTRHDSNAFSRLWWIAELTRDGDNYDLTMRVFARQQLAIPLFVRAFGQSRDLVEAFVDEMEHASADETERVMKELSGTLGVLVLEGLDRATLRDVIRSLRTG
jgi:hypothetical protein